MRSIDVGASRARPPSTRRPCPEVVPRRLRKIERARRGAGLGHGTHEERRAEQELVADVLRADVGAEVHDQRPHHRVALARGLPGDGVDVGQQPVPQPVEARQDLLRLGTVGPQLVLVGLEARAVDPEDRTEGPELEPAHEELAIRRIARGGAHEAADVRRPVRKPGDGVVERRPGSAAGRSASWGSRRRTTRSTELRWLPANAERDRMKTRFWSDAARCPW